MSRWWSSEPWNSPVNGARRSGSISTCWVGRPYRNPAQILANLNDALITPGSANTELGFTTAACLHLTAAGHYTLANAGHIAPYLAGAELQSPPALPLGQTYETTTGTLLPTKTLILMSDGVPEARNPKGTLYGLDRLPTLTLQSATEIAQTAPSFGQKDDITVLSIALA